MQERATTFYSDEYRLDASWFLPDDFDESRRYTGLTVCSGYTGLKAMYPRLLAGQLTAAGYVVLGFDYRGQGASEGTTGRIELHDQITDIQSALTFLDAQRFIRSGLGLIGWGLGAGLSVRVAADSDLVAALGLLNGLYHGKRFYEHLLSDVQIANLRRMVHEAEVRRVTTGQPTLTDPFIAYPLDDATSRVVDADLRPVPGYGGQISIRVAESLYRFNALRHVVDVRCPIAIAHGIHNQLHPVEQAQLLYLAAPEPKRLRYIEGRHNDFMQSGHPVFVEVADQLVDWLDEHLPSNLGADRESAPLRNDGAWDRPRRRPSTRAVADLAGLTT